MKKAFCNAKWIGCGEGNRKTADVSPAIRYRKKFSASVKNTVKCRICGLGYFSLYINGENINEGVLEPDFTAYDKRAYYSEYDLSEHIKIGENLIAVELGDGFYNQTTKDGWQFYNASWRNSPRLIFELFNENGVILSSDNTWKSNNNGPTYHNAVRTGEWYNACKQDNWQSLNYDDSNWSHAVIVKTIGGILEKRIMPEVKICDMLSPISITKTDTGWVYDFGENITGYAGICLRGVKGKTVEIRYSEKLKGGKIDQSNIDWYVEGENFSEDRYTFSGNGLEEWKPKFVYHSFRYLELSGEAITPDINSVKAYFIHTDIKSSGYFTSSDSILNWINKASIRSLLCNFTGILQDCPHREKNGWTGDAALSAKYACFYFDCESAFLKIVKDICDTQRPDGQLCAIAPTSGWGYNWGNGPAWDYALFIIPQTLYNLYGSTEAINYVYPYAKKYLEFMRYMETDNTVAFGIGDWRPPAKLKNRKDVSLRFADSCYYYSILNISAQFAEILGCLEEKQVYLNKAVKVKNAIKSNFFKDGVIDNDSQSAMALALYFDILEGDEAIAIAKKLADTISSNNYIFEVGVLGLNALLYSLSKYGYTDVAYRIVTRKDYPSYNYFKENGATTLWESWEGDVSLNHHLYGYAAHWMAENIAGLRLKEVGYKSFEIKPYFFDDNCSCSVKANTPYGAIEFKWKKQNSVFNIHIAMPEKTACTLCIDGFNEIPIKSGSYKIELSGGSK